MKILTNKQYNKLKHELETRINIEKSCECDKKIETLEKEHHDEILVVRNELNTKKQVVELNTEISKMHKEMETVYNNVNKIHQDNSILKKDNDELTKQVETQRKELIKSNEIIDKLNTMLNTKYKKAVSKK